MTTYATPAALTSPPLAVSTQPLLEQPLLSPSDMLLRTRRLPNVSWSTSDASFSTQAICVPNELFLSHTTVTNMSTFKHFSYSEIKLRLTPVANKYFRGALGLTFWPGPLKSGSDMNPVRISSLPTAIYDASSTEAIEVSLPWTLPLPKVALSSVNEVCGFILMWVISPLVQDTAPGVTTKVVFNLEATFVDPALHDPIPVSNLPLPVIRPVAFVPTGIFAGLQMPKRSKTVNVEAEQKAEKGTISSTLDSVAAISSAASVIPVVGTFASGLSVVASAASSVFDWFGLSKPSNITIPTFVNTGSLPYANCLSGVTTGDVFAAEAIPYVSNEPSLVNSYTDELNMETMRLTPSLVATGTITDTGVEVLSKSIAVNPGYGWYSSPNFYPSNLDFGSRAFRLWRGDISYKIIFSSSALATCRVAITHSLTKLATFSEAVRFMYVDITGTTVVDGTIPWCLQDPYATAPTRFFDSITSSPNGYLQIWQILPLTGDGTGATLAPLTYSVWASAPATFQTAALLPVSVAFVDTPMPQGFLGFESSLTLTKIAYDDDVHSFRELAKRPYWTYVPVTFAANRATLSLSNYLSTHPLFKHLMRRFRFYRGSLIISLRGFTALTDPSVIVMDGDRACSYLWNFERSPECTVTLPYARVNGFTDTGALYSLNEDRKLAFRTLVTTDAAAGVWMSVNFADDMSFGRSLGCGTLA